MQEINPTITFGDPDDISLHQQVTLDDEVVIDREADSLLGPMCLVLYGMFGYNRYPSGSGEEKDRLRLGFKGSYSGPRGRPNYDAGSGFSVDTSVVPCEIKTDDGQDINDHNVYFDRNNSAAYRELPNQGNGTIIILETEQEVLSGPFFTPDRDYDSRFRLYTIDSFNRQHEPTSVTPLDLTGQSVGEIDRICVLDLQGDNSDGLFRVGRRGNRNDELAGSWLMLGNDGRPNDIRHLPGSISNHRFSTSGNSLANPAESPNSSSVLLSRDFTNNSGEDVNINEVWWSTGFRYNHGSDRNNQAMPLARDPTTLTVPANSTITVQYRIECNNQGGGLMQMFMGLLYRHLGTNNYEVSRIDGTSVSEYRDREFYCVSPGGYGLMPTGQYRHDELGPQIGTDGTATDNSMSDLQSRIDHGKESGKVIYDASHVEPIDKDYANQRYAFDVVRRFRNVSGSSIDVNETGLYVGGGEYDRHPEDIHMIARHTPSATIADGEAAEVRYTFEIALP